MRDTHVCDIRENLSRVLLPRNLGYTLDMVMERRISNACTRSIMTSASHV